MPVQLADFCALLCPEDPEDAGEGGCSGAATVRSCLAALGFIASKAKVQLLTTALSDPSVEGYKRASVSQAERKEAAPFSLAAVSQVKDSEAYTAHSAKATVISWGRQLDLDDTDLAKQGHHKVALGHCAGLYGRDDVFKALKVQASVLTALRQGWVPMRAQRRGAAQPLDEPPLQHKLRPLHEREFEAGFRSHFKPQLPGAALGIQTSVVDIASHRDLKKSLGFANLLQERSRRESASRYVKEHQIAIL